MSKTYVHDTSTAMPTAEVVMIDPVTAQHWLNQNHVNRHVRKDHVDSLARDMESGGWTITGEAIKISRTGALLDGQHRLLAIVKSGITVPLFVVTGIDDDAQAQMDAGRKRTAADVLSMDGETDAVLLAAIARFVLTYQRTGNPKTGGADITTSEIREYVRSHPEIRAAKNIARRMTGHVDAKPVVVGYAYLTLSRIDPADAEDFFARWLRMTDMREGDPLLALVQKLAIVRRQRERLSHRDELSLIFRAWNATRKRRSLRALKVRSQVGEVPIPDPI